MIPAGPARRAQTVGELLMGLRGSEKALREEGPPPIRDWPPRKRRGCHNPEGKGQLPVRAPSAVEPGAPLVATTSKAAVDVSVSPPKRGGAIACRVSTPGSPTRTEALSTAPANRGRNRANRPPHMPPGGLVSIIA